MLEVQNLCRIESVSFKVARSAIVGFLDLSAAGKSTTVRIITGHD